MGSETATKSRETKRAATTQELMSNIMTGGEISKKREAELAKAADAGRGIQFIEGSPKVKGLTQKNVASKTYYDNVVRPVKARAKEVGKKIVDIKAQIKAARELFKTENARLRERQLQKLNKYYDLEAKRAEAIVIATTNYNDPKVLSEVSKDLGEPMVGINIDTLSEE